MNKLFTLALAALSLTACAKQPKEMFPYHYSQTDVTGIPAQLPEIDVRIRHYE